jgi:hypothetical protein
MTESTINKPEKPKTVKNDKDLDNKIALQRTEVDALKKTMDRSTSVRT